MVGYCLSKRLDRSLELANVGTNNGLDLLTVLEKEKGGHGRDTVLLGDIGALVDVDLDEVGGGGGLSELLENGRDHLAGATPGGVKVNDSETGEGNLGVEILESLDFLDHGGQCRRKVSGGGEGV